MNLQAFFDRTFIVNLPDRADRRRDMEQELEKAGMSLQPGKLDFFRAVRPDGLDGFPSLGARGCFLSHLSILRQAIREGLQNVLVMEDDLALSSVLKTDADGLLERLRSQPWHFAYFGHILPSVERRPAQWEETRAGIVTTHFYAMHGSIMPRVVEFLEAVLTRPDGHPDGGRMHVDGAYNFFRERNPDVITLVAQPNLGWQRPSRSDVADLKWFDRTPVLRELATVARRFKPRPRQ